MSFYNSKLSHSSSISVYGLTAEQPVHWRIVYWNGNQWYM